MLHRNSEFLGLFEMGSSALQGLHLLYGELMEGSCCDSLAWDGHLATERECC